MELEKNITYDNCEWCFQFDNDEPYPFAAAKKEDLVEEPSIKFILSNNKNSVITFSHNGKTFKLFPRELTPSGELLINKTE
jgi:hypothetical protein